MVRASRLTVLATLLAVCLLEAGCSCQRLPICGAFAFTGSKYDTSTENGIDMSLRFDFNPATCGAACSADSICYVQIVRTVDLEGGTYLYPSAEKAARATPDGWYLDRLEGKKWGYYGRNDDGTFASTLSPGGNTTPTVLVDAPRRPEMAPYIWIFWEAVSVPVTIRADASCTDRLLGYYFWGWIVAKDGSVAGPLYAPAWEPMENDVDGGVAGWNAQAPGLGNYLFPVLARL